MARLVRELAALIGVSAWLLPRGPLLAQSGSPEVSEPQPAAALVDIASLEQVLGKDIAKGLEIARDIWNTALIVGPDKTKPIVTVGTLAGGIVLLGLGYIAAGMISRWVARKLLTRFGLNKSGVAPLQSLTFYLLLAMFTMVSLNVL